MLANYILFVKLSSVFYFIAVVILSFFVQDYSFLKENGLGNTEGSGTRVIRL